jgi:hypothetical protein
MFWALPSPLLKPIGKRFAEGRRKSRKHLLNKRDGIGGDGAAETELGEGRGQLGTLTQHISTLSRKCRTTTHTEARGLSTLRFSWDVVSGGYVLLLTPHTRSNSYRVGWRSICGTIRYGTTPIA